MPNRARPGFKGDLNTAEERSVDAVVERKIEMIWHFDGLITRDQNRQSNYTTVARREAGTLPYVPCIRFSG